MQRDRMRRIVIVQHGRSVNSDFRAWRGSDSLHAASGCPALWTHEVERLLLFQSKAEPEPDMAPAAAAVPVMHSRARVNLFFQQRSVIFRLPIVVPAVHGPCSG